MGENKNKGSKVKPSLRMGRLYISTVEQMRKHEAMGMSLNKDETTSNPTEQSGCQGIAGSDRDGFWEAGRLRIGIEGDVDSSQYPDQRKLDAKVIFQENKSNFSFQKWTRSCLKWSLGGQYRGPAVP